MAQLDVGKKARRIKVIVGSWDIASVLVDRKGFCFFASGVSNSQETRESEYKRERMLLMEQRKDLKLVYFSSLDALDGKSRYYQHKREMEELVKKGFRYHTIIRLGNITWGTNPHTIINSMKKIHEKGVELEIRDVYRYLVDKADFLYWISKIPKWNCEISITGKRMKVKDLVEEYVYD